MPVRENPGLEKMVQRVLGQHNHMFTIRIKNILGIFILMCGVVNVY
jgi:hypothetical protein